MPLRRTRADELQRSDPIGDRIRGRDDAQTFTGLADPVGHSALHHLSERWPVARGRIQPVFEHEGGDALIGQQASDLHPLMIPGKRHEAPARRNDHGGAGRFCRVGEDGQQGGFAGIADAHVAGLAEPDFRSVAAGHEAGAKRYRLLQFRRGGQLRIGRRGA